jgi:hypothetical protein
MLPNKREGFMRFVDLSVTIRNQSFEPGGPEIVRMNHHEAARRRLQLLAERLSGQHGNGA